MELFGKNLCAIFNEYLQDYYYFQKFTPTIRTDKERPIWQQGEERKKLAIIGPNLYDENSQHNYSSVRVVDMAYPRPHSLEPFTSRSREYPLMFSKAPLKLDEKEFLLYFGDYAFENVQICLGHIENCGFVPTDCFKTSPTTEIDHSNPIYLFVEDFVKIIFNYKILNKKPILDQNDMQLILEEFGISRKQKLQTLVGLLKTMKEEFTEILLGSNNVENVLELKRNNKN